MTLPNLRKKLKTPHFSLNMANNGYKKYIYSKKEFSQVLEHERQRANRNKHRFSLIVLELGSAKIDEAIPHRFINKITNRLRIIDEIGWYGSERVGIILPYTSSPGAHAFAESLRDVMDSSIPISICTICTYPPGCDVDKQELPIIL